MRSPKCIYWAAAVCLTVLVSTSCGTGEEKGDKKEAAPPAGQAGQKTKPGLDLGLTISPGAPGEASLIAIRLFSGSLRQSELDNAARKEGQRSAIEPLRLTIPRESWAGVEFRILGREAAPEAKEAPLGAVLVEAPKSESVSLGPKDALTAVYRIPSANLPLPGTLVRAEMKAAGDVILSEAIPVPNPPDSEKGLLLRKAEIRLKLKSWAEAKAAAEEIIERFPGEAAGYWLKAQTLEGEGLDAEALKMYNTALEKALAQKDADQVEPPLPIIIKIRDLEEKISASTKK